MRSLIRTSLLGIALLVLVFGEGHSVTDSLRSVSSQTPDCSEELLSRALAAIKRKQYRRGRLRLAKLVAEECWLKPVARLLIADGYYRGGGYYDLCNAQSEYGRWLELFPHHALAPLVTLKLAETHLRQLSFGCFRNPLNHAAAANILLLQLQDGHPQFRAAPIVLEYTAVVQELLAEHDVKIAKFYLDQRAPEAAKLRCLHVIEKFPRFTRTDAALWYLEQALEAEDDAAGALQYYQRITREYHDSDYWFLAAQQLAHSGRVIMPEQDWELTAERRLQSLRLSLILSDLGAYAKSISNRGVLLDHNDEVDDDLLLNYSEQRHTHDHTIR